MYKKASRMNLLIPTVKGSLTVTQCWSLTKKQLSDSLNSIYKQLQNNSNELDFIENPKEDDDIRFMFNILKDIYITKEEEANKQKSDRENKIYNQRILEIIHKKQEESLNNLSVKELESLLK